MFRAILLSSLVLNFGLLLGRVSGFIRQAFIAATYGDSADADTVIFMLTVPDLLVNILMGGALGAVLIPAFSKTPDHAKKLLFQATAVFGMAALALAILFSWKSDFLVSLLAPGFEGKQSSDASAAFRYVALLIPLTVMAGGTTAFLQFKNRFAIPSLGTLIVNASIIVGLYIVYTGHGSIVIVAWFTILGGLLRLLSQVFASGLKFTPFSAMKPFLLDCVFFKHYGRAMLTGSLLILFPVVAKAASSFSGEGSYATMDYALKLIQFPLVIAITFIVTVFFPRLSKAHTDNNNHFSLLLSHSVQLIVAVSLIATTALYFVSFQYTSLAYQHGNMDVPSIQSIGALTAVGLISLPFQGLVTLLMSSKFAQKNTTTPLIVNLSGLLFFSVLTTTQVFGEGLDALMWGLVISYALIGIAYICIVHRDTKIVLTSLLDPRYLLSLAITCVLLSFMVIVIRQSGFSSVVAVSLAFMSGCFSLILMVFLYPKTRTLLLSKLHSS